MVSVEPPSTWLGLTEIPRALLDLGSLGLAPGLLRLAPRGDGHPVLILPGFALGDGATSVLRRSVRNLGYDASGWELGRNMGWKAIGVEGEKLLDRVRATYEATGRKVSLVGWSLGGVMARQISRKLPELVRQIITLGASFTGNPRATKGTQIYERLTSERVQDAQMRHWVEENSEVPPVPSTSIYSRFDGMVPWENCQEATAPSTDNVEVRSGHLGLVLNATVLYVVADRLAQPDGQWEPFHRKGWRALLYPSVAPS